MAMSMMTTNEFVEEGSLPEGLMTQILLLASKWGDTIDVKSIKMVHLINGSTANKVYRVTWPAHEAENDVRTVLVRIYGTSCDSFLNRDKEIQTFESISKLGHGPKLLGKFPEGRIEEFIHAKTLTASDVRDPEISALIAAKVKEFHNLDMPGSKKQMVWEVLRKFLSTAKSMCTTEHAKEFRLDTIEEEIRLLESELSQGNQDFRFCHNDLQCGNIMIDEKTRKITLIDFEYSSYNPVAFDLAYHFCEMTTNFETDTPHLLNFNIYPDLEERQRFIRLYLSSTGNQPSEAEVENLVHDAEKYSLAIHLICGLWGITSYYVNDIEFDYIAHARQRFDRYWLTKPLLLRTTQVNGIASSTT